jgi:hypothetical protein
MNGSLFLALASIFICASSDTIFFMAIRLSRIVDALLEIKSWMKSLPEYQPPGGETKSVEIKVTDEMCDAGRAAANEFFYGRTASAFFASCVLPISVFSYPR